MSQETFQIFLYVMSGIAFVVFVSLYFVRRPMGAVGQ